MSRTSIAAGGTPNTRSDIWETPPEIFAQLHEIFNFQIDVCANHQNAKLTSYWTEKTDALKQTWVPYRCFNNPPYSRKEEFLEKAHQESLWGALVVNLLPAATDAQWFHQYGKFAEVWLLEGRIQFLLNGERPRNPAGKLQGNTKGSCLLIYRPFGTMPSIQYFNFNK